MFKVRAKQTIWFVRLHRLSKASNLIGPTALTLERFWEIFPFESDKSSIPEILFVIDIFYIWVEVTNGRVLAYQMINFRALTSIREWQECDFDFTLKQMLSLSNCVLGWWLHFKRSLSYSILFATAQLRSVHKVSTPHTSRPIKKCAPYFKCSSLFSSYANSVSKQRPFSKFQNIREPRACALIRCASNRQDSHTLGRMSIFLCGGLGQCILRDIVIIGYNLCEVMGDHSTIMQLCT